MPQKYPLVLEYFFKKMDLIFLSKLQHNFIDSEDFLEIKIWFNRYVQF